MVQYERWYPLIFRSHRSCDLIIHNSRQFAALVRLKIWLNLFLVCYAAADHDHILSVLPAVADKHALHSSCMSQLQFSLNKHSALTLEGVFSPMT